MNAGRCSVRKNWKKRQKYPYWFVLKCPWQQELGKSRNATLLHVWRVHSFRSVLQDKYSTLWRLHTFWYIKVYPSWSTWWLEAIIFIFAISEWQQCKRKLIEYTTVMRYQLQITLKLPSSNWFCVFKPTSRLLPPLPWLFDEDIFCTTPMRLMIKQNQRIMNAWNVK